MQSVGYILENVSILGLRSLSLPKMEERIQALEGVESATITFATKQLRLGVADPDVSASADPQRSAHPLSSEVKVVREPAPAFH